MSSEDWQPDDWDRLLARGMRARPQPMAAADLAQAAMLRAQSTATQWGAASAALLRVRRRAQLVTACCAALLAIVVCVGSLRIARNGQFAVWITAATATSTADAQPATDGSGNRSNDESSATQSTDTASGTGSVLFGGCLLVAALVVVALLKAMSQDAPDLAAWRAAVHLSSVIATSSIGACLSYPNFPPAYRSRL